jgi:hypothetical protein
MATMVYVVTYDGKAQQVFSTKADADSYVMNASQGGSSGAGGNDYNVELFQVSALGANGEVLAA